MNHIAQGLVVVATLFGATTPGICQDNPPAKLVLREGEFIGYIPPGGGVGVLREVVEITSVAGNSAGGYAVVCESRAINGVRSLSHIWGTGNGNNPGVLFSEGEYAGLTQASLGRRVAIDPQGNTAADVNVLGAPFGFRDSVWSGVSPFAVEGEQAPSHSGLYWRYATAPQMTDAGEVYWLGGLTTDGSILERTTSSGLFHGIQGQALLLSGMSVPGLPYPLAALDSVGPEFSISGSGAHFIAAVRMDSGDEASDQAIVFDGSGLQADGGLMREGVVITAAGALQNEVWSRPLLVDTNDIGMWIAAMRTSVGDDEYVVVVSDSGISLRSGQAIDGLTLAASLTGLALNNDGDTVSIWGVVSELSDAWASVGTLLLYNDSIVAREGDAVDYDGDGVADPDYTLRRLRGRGWLGMSDRSPTGLPRVYIHVNALVTKESTGESFGAVLRIEARAPNLGCASIDYDHDGMVTTADFDAYMLLYSSSDPDADLNGDGLVNSQDISVFVALFADCTQP